MGLLLNSVHFVRKTALFPKNSQIGFIDMHARICRCNLTACLSAIQFVHFLCYHI